MLVTGKSPAYTASRIRWDCTSTNVRMHWTNDNERYCYQDWQAVVRAVQAGPGRHRDRPAHGRCRFRAAGDVPLTGSRVGGITDADPSGVWQTR